MRNFNDVSQRPCQIDTVIIPIAGKGTRLLPTTKAIPKHFLDVDGVSLIQYAVDEAKRAGAKHFVFIVDADPLNQALIKKHFLPDSALEEHLHEQGKEGKLAELKEIELKPEQISFVVQTEQTGLWDAVKGARGHIVGDTFAVITPDDLILPSMAGLPDLARHHPKDGISFSVEEVPQEEDTSKFGIVKYSSQNKDGTYRVAGVIEKPAPGKEPSRMAIAGRYILPTALLDLYKPEQQASVAHEISIAHAINAFAHKMPVSALLVAGKKFDGGSKVGRAMATLHVYEQDPEISPALAQRNAAAKQGPKTFRHGMRAAG